MASAPLGNTLPRLRPEINSELVIRFYLQSLARDLLPTEKVKDCMRTIAPFKSNVEIAKSEGATKAHYRNLVICSRIWQCAVCASTISEIRRKELTGAISNSGLYPVLLTYTLRHQKKDKLDLVLSTLLDAFRKYKSGRLWQEFMTEYSWVGSVRALEVTYGENGWHPHLHELALLRIPVTGAIEHGMSQNVKDLWRKAVDRAGGNASWERGADLRTEDHEIREYVAKWGHLPNGTKWTVEHEITKAVIKRSKKDGRTPMQLLLDYGDGDKKGGALFIEYSRAFKGRNQLVWSRGLKALLGITDDLTDQEIAENAATSGHVLATLSRSDWTRVLSLKHRAQLLEFASSATEDELADYLNELLFHKQETTPA